MEPANVQLGGVVAQPSLLGRNAREIVEFLEAQPGSTAATADSAFAQLLGDATRPGEAPPQSCTRLCGFVQQCVKSKNAEFREWAFRQGTAMGLLSFYLEWTENNHNSSMKLALDALAVLIRENPDREASGRTRSEALAAALRVANWQSTRTLGKSAYGVLYYFLNKPVCTMQDMLVALEKTLPVPLPEAKLDIWRDFIQLSISWMAVAPVSPIAGKTIALVMRNLAVDEPGFHMDLWLVWLVDGLAARPALLEDIGLHVLGHLLKIDKKVSLAVLQAFNRSNLTQASVKDDMQHAVQLQLAALDIGKKWGLVIEPGADRSSEADADADAVVELDKEVLELLLSHPAQATRSTAFALLAISRTRTAPMTWATVQLLEKHLPAFHSDFDAKFRNDVVSNIKYMLWRAKGGVTLASSMSDTRRTGQGFLNWYLCFLKTELRPTASYQRHITALKALAHFVRAGRAGAGSDSVVDPVAADVVLSDAVWIRLILDRVMDPFDDVREESAALLTLLVQHVHAAGESQPSGSAEFREQLRSFSDRASRLAARTSRADHGDGAARSLGVVCKSYSDLDGRLGMVVGLLAAINDKLLRADQNLGQAVVDFPVHGDFAALRKVWEVLAESLYSPAELERIYPVQVRAVAACRRIWGIVEHVLCDDSPEGLLPEEMEDVDGLDTQDVLSYSFRAIHESSSLMREMILPLRARSSASRLVPSAPVFEAIGWLAFEQLSKLRHRGAFSTVSSTFTACCQLSRAGAVGQADGSDGLVKAWYEGTLSCIMTQASTTRRSAGIPALLVGTLTANMVEPSFGDVFGRLCGIAAASVAPTQANETARFPQVHALNCVKEIFKSSLLRKKAEPFLTDGLQLAARSLRSPVWAIRNCALILLRSLVDCMLSGGNVKAEAGPLESRAGQTVKIHYDRYPGLPALLVEILQDAPGEEGPTEAVFPVLDILGRAGPPEEFRDELYRLVAGYTRSSLWHVREIAARTLCSFLDTSEWLEPLGLLLESAKGHRNGLHGALLTAKILLEQRMMMSAGAQAVQPGELHGLQQVFLRELKHPRPEFGSPEVCVLCFQIVNLLWDAAHCQSKGLRLALQELGGQAALADALVDHLDSSAPLRVAFAAYKVRCAAEANDVKGLSEVLSGVLGRGLYQTDEVATVLDDVSQLWPQHGEGGTGAAQLCELCIEICIQAAAPSVRLAALNGVVASMDSIKRQVAPQQRLPSLEQLQKLWGSLTEGVVSPSLYCAVLSTSGLIMGAVAERAAAAAAAAADPMGPTRPETGLAAWGVMIGTALTADNSFDVRRAAAKGLRLFLCTLGTATTTLCSSPGSVVPIVLALYDALNDDDDEIRDMAAIACAPLTGRHVVAAEAPDHLLAWLLGRDAIRGVGEAVVARMSDARPRDTGTASPGTPAPDPWEPFASQLEQALVQDNSLFAVEEQNLFVDPVREAERWASVFRSLARAGADSGSTNPPQPSFVEAREVSALQAWTLAGLDHLLQVAQSQSQSQSDNGPLGWTSDARVFALCAKLLVCGKALLLAGSSAAEDLERLLGRLSGVQELGRLLQGVQLWSEQRDAMLVDGGHVGGKE